MISRDEKSHAELVAEIEKLRFRLQESEQTLEAITSGAVDAVVARSDEGVKVFTLQGADHAYRVLIEQMNEGAATLGPEGTILYCNAKLSEMLNTPLEKIIGTRLCDFVHPAHTATFDALVEIGYKGSSRGEIQLWTDDEEAIPAYVSCRDFQMEDIHCLCVVVTDIREIKQTEERLRRANRALKVLSAFDRVMVGCSDEFHLLNEACRILVEIGGYRTAWIGMVGEDEAKSIIQVAHAGYRDHHFAGLRVSLTDEDTGSVFMATTIQSGKISIERDVLANPSLTSMHERARFGGLSSVLVLPIMIGETPIGGLTVWASEPAAFDDEETRLLAELAENASYGYTSIKTSQEWKRAEDQLRAVQEQYAQVVETQTELVCRFRPDLTLTFVNESYCRLFGKTAGELIGKSFTRFIAPDDRERVKAFVRSLRPGEVSSDFENRITLSNGSIKWYQWTTRAINNEQDNIVEFQSVGRDVTDRKIAEEALQLSEERFRAIFEHAQDYIYVKDSSRKYVNVNPALEALHGLPASKIVGRTDLELFGKEAEEHIGDADNRVLAGQSIEERHTMLFGGAQRTFHDVKVPMYDRQGAIVGVLGISREITDQRTDRISGSSLAEDYPSKAMQAALKKANSVAPTDSVLLLLGESGSGKDYLARYVHEKSKRASGPFFVLNCAAVSSELAESELFGHEKGSFTGAHARKRGLLELAEGGTLLLNEIGELSPLLQSKLLTFLDTRSFTRVGGERAISINARLITATNRDLRKEVREGRFREDLFYRISVMVIETPPLRERKEDFPLLVRECLAQLAADMQLPRVPAVDAADMRALLRYPWPGNVRELRNVLERALILWTGGPLSVPVQQSETGSGTSDDSLHLSHGRKLTEVTGRMTESLCVDALSRCRGNKKQAAKLLGISRDTLYRYIRRFNLESEDPTSVSSSD